MNLLVNQIRGQKLFQGAAVKIERNFVSVEAAPICGEHSYMLRNGIDELPKFPFCLLAILDVGPGKVPADNVSLIVSERSGAHEKPAILPVFPPQTYFRFPWLSGCQARLPQTIVVPQLLRMKTVLGVYCEKLLQAQAVIVEHYLVGVKTLTISVKHDDVLRNSVDELPKFGFRLLPIVDVSSGCVPADDVSLFVPKRVETN